ncbi:MAG: hypothetical protein JXR96_25130 [Deltaproteobacteria bacterium]|nr:hypothetical protein [Deltaproteobacteria bacterium]
MPFDGKRLIEKEWLDDKEKLERLAVLILREIDRILFDLEFRREMLFKLWSKERIRMPLLRVLHSRYYELKFDLLILFPPDVFQQLDRFYRALDSFVFYASYTEDMPQSLMQSFDAFLKDLKEMSGPLLEMLKRCAPGDFEVEMVSAGPPPLVFELSEGQEGDLTFEDTDPGRELPTADEGSGSEGAG